MQWETMMKCKSAYENLGLFDSIPELCLIQCLFHCESFHLLLCHSSSPVSWLDPFSDSSSSFMVLLQKFSLFENIPVEPPSKGDPVLWPGTEEQDIGRDAPVDLCDVADGSGCSTIDVYRSKNLRKANKASWRSVMSRGVSRRKRLWQRKLSWNQRDMTTRHPYGLSSWKHFTRQGSLSPTWRETKSSHKVSHNVVNVFASLSDSRDLSMVAQHNKCNLVQHKLVLRKQIVYK